jgi:hypothetical protein
MRRVAVLAVFALALALSATATAGKVQLGGAVSAAPGSKVKLTITKQGGEIRKITKLKFQRVPINCQDGQGGAITGRALRSFPVSGKDFTRKTRIQGVGIQKGYFRVSGKFRRGGKVAKGSVRFAIQRPDGVGCGTGDLRWKAEK